jgi:hypothetical protein
MDIQSREQHVELQTVGLGRRPDNAGVDADGCGDPAQALSACQFTKRKYTEDL